METAWKDTRPISGGLKLLRSPWVEPGETLLFGYFPKPVDWETWSSEAKVAYAARHGAKIVIGETPDLPGEWN